MDQTMAAAVSAALTSRTGADPRDAGAEALARQYATLLDHAAPAKRYRRALEQLRRAVAGESLEEDEPWEALATVAEALSQHTVTSDLGPKLLTTLTALGLTPAARATRPEGGRPQHDQSDPLDQLRRKHEERKLHVAR
jgi:hypothetical protein